MGVGDESREPPRLEVVGKSDNLSVDLDEFLAKRF